MSIWSDLLGTIANKFRIGVVTTATLDASGLSSAQTYTLPDTSGILGVVGQNCLSPTGSGANLTGLTWEQVSGTLTSAGSIAQISVPASGPATPGTISVSAGGTVVTGSGTAFLTTFARGQTITANGETHVITGNISSDTSLTTTAWTSATSGATYTVSPATALVVDGSGGIRLSGTPVQVTKTLFNVSPTYSQAISAPVIAGWFNPTISQTTVTQAAQIVGIRAGVGIGAANTQNWSGSAIGMLSSVGVATGATGTFTSLVGIQSIASVNTGATATALVGVSVTLASGGGTGTLAVGMQTTAGASGTNNIDLVLGAYSSLTGNWGIYQQTSLDNTFAGRTQIARGTTPTISSGGGTGASVVGTDQAHLLTSGTGTVTHISVTFSSPLSFTPTAVCITPANSASATVSQGIGAYVSAVSSSGYILTGAVLNATAYYVHVF